MFRNKIANIVFSILVAVALWVYVVGEVNPETVQTFEDIPIKYLNVDELANDGLAIVSSGETVTTVTLTGKRADLRSISPSDISVTVDMAGLLEGENVVRLKAAVPSAVAVSAMAPSEITVTVDDLVSVEKPVEIVYDGSIPRGMEPGAITLAPAEVSVSGASSVVDAVSAVRATVSVSDISEEGSSVTSKLAPVNEDGGVVSFVTLSDSEAAVQISMLTLKTVPLEVPQTGTLPEGLQLVSQDFPDTITVKGLPEDLASLTRVETAPILLGEITGTTTLPLTPVLPDGIETAWESTSLEGTLTIAPVTILTFTYNMEELVISGLGDGLDMTLPEGSVTLEVVLTEENDTGLTKADFEIAADLSGLTDGKQMVPLTVNTDASYMEASIDPKNITITISSE